MKINRGALAVVLAAILITGLIVACQPAPQPQNVYGGAVYFPPGGNQLVVGSGGELELQSGSTLDVQAGAAAALGAAVVSAPTAIATATPALVVDSAGVSNILEVRDAATPVFAIRNGGTAVLGSYTLAWSAPITISGVLSNVRVLYFQVP